MIKIKFWHIITFLLITIPLSAYIDTIRTGTFPFQQYLSICLWEGGLVLGGFGLGIMFQKSNNE